MKAAHTPLYGPPSVLDTRIVPTPTPGPGQVLVEVHASFVSAGDLRLRAADFPGISALFGRLMFGLRRPRNPIQGSMFSGRVVAVGSGVRRYAKGDEVFGSVDHGAYAEFLVVEEGGAVAPLPAGVSHAEAAATPYGAWTALNFLRDLGALEAGEKVLILGASGGVGQLAVQVARHLGAEVTAVASARHHDFVRGLGAQHVLDYTREDFTQNGERYDVIFDIAGASSFRKAKGSLTDTGRYLSLYVSGTLLAQMLWTRVFARRGKRAMCGVAMGDAASTAELAALLGAGAIRPVIGQRFAFEAIADAHVHAETSRSAGATVVEMVPPERPLAAVG